MDKKIRLSGYQIISIFIFVLFLSGTSIADVPRFYGKEVVVTATRLPRLSSDLPWNIDVITAEELENFTNVGEAVRQVAGVDVITYGALGSVTSARIQGFNASQVLVLVDGRRINSPTLGMFDLGDILVGNIERIEVVKAPLSAVYGSDAVSGVINIITKSPKEVKRAISVSAGSFGRQQYAFSLAGENYWFSADHLAYGGFRTNSDYLADNVFGKLAFPSPLGQLILDGSYYSAGKGIPGVPTSEADPSSASEPNDRQADKNVMLSGAVKSDNYTLRFYQNILEQRLDPYIYGISSNKAWQTGVEWQQAMLAPAARYLYGFEAREDKGETTMSGSHTIRNYAAFLQGEFELHKRLLFSATVRTDKHSMAGWSSTPRGGLVYKLRRGVNLKVSAGSSFRAPTLNELFWDDPAWQMYGNQNLKPERAFSYDIGLERIFPSGRSISLRYFNSLITDMILWNYDLATYQTQAVNIGEVRSDGVEFALEQSLGRDKRSYLNFTYQNAVDNKAAVGKVIPYTPYVKLNAGVILGGNNIFLRHVGKRYADSQNTVELPPYTVVDWRMSRQINDLMVELAVDNLLDEQYSEAIGYYLDPSTFAFEQRNYPMPGRSYRIGVKREI